MSDRVLLTGISGFLGGHVALALLAAGYTVRGSVRDRGKAEAVRQTLGRAGADVSRLEFVELDLLRGDGWDAAMEGVRYLQHTASPFLLRMPKDRMALVRPAVEGTARALEAGLKADVERIVLTSSMAAIAYGHDISRTAPFTADDWTDLDGRGGVNSYVESKTRAERRAWEIMDAARRTADLSVINPSFILGPLLDRDPGTSAAVIQRLMNGSIPAAPRIPLVIVDVRDVAAAHVAAMTAAEAGGRRFPVAERTLYLREIAAILRQAFPERARKIPRREMPDWIVRLYGLFDRDVRSNAGELGVFRRVDSSAVVRLLGRELVPAREAIVATGESVIREGLI